MTHEHICLIAAPAPVVWTATEDVERWPEWQPTVTSVCRLDGGPFGLGSRALIKQPLQPEAEWTVTRYEPGRAFAWESRRPGLRFVGTHEVEPTGTGTRSRLRVEASGPLAALMGPLLGPAIRRSLAAENGALRRRSEASAMDARHPEQTGDIQNV